jgi:hypothetical protein
MDESEDFALISLISRGPNLGESERTVVSWCSLPLSCFL